MGNLLITFESFVNELATEPAGGTFYHHEEPTYSDKHEWQPKFINGTFIGKICTKCGAKIIKNDMRLYHRSSPTKYMDVTGRPSKDMPACQPELKGMYGTSSDPVFIPREKKPIEVPSSLLKLDDFIKQQKEKQQKIELHKKMKELGYKPSKLKSTGIIKNIEYFSDKVKV